MELFYTKERCVIESATNWAIKIYIENNQNMWDI